MILQRRKRREREDSGFLNVFGELFKEVLTKVPLIQCYFLKVSQSPPVCHPPCPALLWLFFCVSLPLDPDHFSLPVSVSKLCIYLITHSFGLHVLVRARMLRGQMGLWGSNSGHQAQQQTSTKITGIYLSRQLLALLIFMCVLDSEYKRTNCSNFRRYLSVSWG